MAAHQSDCDVCSQLSLCESNTHPRFVIDLPMSAVVMGPHQVWPGYTMLLCRQPVTELDELAADDYDQLMRELRDVARAVRNVTGAHKLNYEALGNQCHHLHWHIFPRQADETRVLEPIWTSFPDDMTAHRFDPQAHDDLRQQLRNLLTSPRS